MGYDLKRGVLRCGLWFKVGTPVKVIVSVMVCAVVVDCWCRIEKKYQRGRGGKIFGDALKTKTPGFLTLRKNFAV